MKNNPRMMAHPIYVDQWKDFMGTPRKFLHRLYQSAIIGIFLGWVAGMLLKYSEGI